MHFNETSEYVLQHTQFNEISKYVMQHMHFNKTSDYVAMWYMQFNKA